MCVSGILLIALGCFCIMNTGATLLSAALLLGCLALSSGIAKMVFTFRTQAFLPNSGSRALSALLDIFIGFFLLFHPLGTAIALPVVFVIWIVIEGISIAVRSFDYKKFGFPYWWCLLILGVAAAVVGFLGLKNLDASAAVLSTLIGIAIILNGIAYILAVAGINRFEKKISDMLNA